MAGTAFSQHEFTRANCAGQGCGDRENCRRYVVLIEGPADVWWRKRSGQWISADIERLLDEGRGACPQFRALL